MPPEAEAQLDMGFAVYATPACNAARKRYPPPEPDENWLFDAGGVEEICGRRQCRIHVKSELVILVVSDGWSDKAGKLPTPVTLTAARPGRWHPVDILASYTKANGNTVYDVDLDKAVVTNPPIGDERHRASQDFDRDARRMLADLGESVLVS
jgi:hypothetical protein